MHGYATDEVVLHEGLWPSYDGILCVLWPCLTASIHARKKCVKDLAGGVECNSIAGLAFTVAAGTTVTPTAAPEVKKCGNSFFALFWFLFMLLLLPSLVPTTDSCSLLRDAIKLLLLSHRM